MAPYRSVCAPAAFVDGHPAHRAVRAAGRIDREAESRSPAPRRRPRRRSTPGPHRSAAGRRRRPRPTAVSRLTSTMTPSPIAPPAMLLPDPRGISGVRRRRRPAHERRRRRRVGRDRDRAGHRLRDARRLAVRRRAPPRRSGMRRERDPAGRERRGGRSERDGRRARTCRTNRRGARMRKPRTVRTWPRARSACRHYLGRVRGVPSRRLHAPPRLDLPMPSDLRRAAPVVPAALPARRRGAPRRGRAPGRPSVRDVILPAVSRTFALEHPRAPRATLGRAVLDGVSALPHRRHAGGRAGDRRRGEGGRCSTSSSPASTTPAAADAFPARRAPTSPANRRTCGSRSTPTWCSCSSARCPAARGGTCGGGCARWSLGMRKFVLLYPHGIRIQTLEEYKEYCYYVAGTVGYLLTDLWHEHAPSIGERQLRRAARAVPRLRRGAADGEHPQGRRARTRSTRTRSTCPRSCCARTAAATSHDPRARAGARNARGAGDARAARVARPRGRAELPAADPAARGVHPPVLRAAAAVRLRDAARPRAERGDAAAGRRR